MDLIAPFARILLRYVAMALVAHGWLAEDMGSSIAADPDLQIMLGAALGAVAEGWYWIARRLGWTT